MDVGPLPPPPTNPNPTPNLPDPPRGRPPDPNPAAIAPEKTPFKALDNPYRGPVPEEVIEAHKQSLMEALDFIRSPFWYSLTEPLRFNGESLGGAISPSDFNAAVALVLTAMEVGYHPNQQNNLLDLTNWARLACSLMATIGWGLARHCESNSEQEKRLDQIRASVINDDPITREYPTLFHCLAAMASHVEMHVAPDLESYPDWYFNSKMTFDRLATKAAVAEVEESWRQWKADQIDRCATAQEAKITDAVRNRNLPYFFNAVESIGLSRADKGQYDPPHLTTPTTGNKRTVSGSLPKGKQTTTTPQRAIPPNTTQTPRSLVETPRGRQATLAWTHGGCVAEPSPTPAPKNPPTALPQLLVHLAEETPTGDTTPRQPPHAAERANP
ncbi:hypothetical protein BC827DRAFT_1375715 [Russula dissimulans]|nr:hypothetical protein BC827DRAFT_1375715 [Russula dissimulans]